MWYIIWALFMAYGIYLFVLVWMRQSAAKVVSAEEFGKDLRHGQLIDVREKDEFKAAHILGARNIPYSQFKERFMELRKDQPIYLYEEGVSIAGRCAYRLKKNGYTNIYILKHGFEAWNGKVKKEKTNMEKS